MYWLALVAALHTQTVAPVAVQTFKDRDACLAQASRFNSTSPSADRPPLARTQPDHVYLCLALVYPS